MVDSDRSLHPGVLVLYILIYGLQAYEVVSFCFVYTTLNISIRCINTGRPRTEWTISARQTGVLLKFGFVPGRVQLWICSAVAQVQCACAAQLHTCCEE